MWNFRNYQSENIRIGFGINQVIEMDKKMCAMNSTTSQPFCASPHQAALCQNNGFLQIWKRIEKLDIKENQLTQLQFFF